jgi:hypothetical protein
MFRLLPAVMQTALKSDEHLRASPRVREGLARMWRTHLEQKSKS